VLSQLVHRHMAVPEDDHVGIGKPTMQSPRPARPAPAVVDHCDLHPAELEEPALGEKPLEFAVVVPEHGVRLGHHLQFGQRLSGRDVTGVEHDVGPGHRVEHLVSDTVDPFGEMAVGKHDHLHPPQLVRPRRVRQPTRIGQREWVQTPTAPKESCWAAAAPRRWSNVVVISGSTRRVTAHM